MVSAETLTYAGIKIAGVISRKDKSRDEDPVLAKKPDPGLCASNEGRF